MEKKILAAALKSREAYDIVKGVKYDQTMTELGKQLLKVADDYYERDPEAKGADKDIVLAQIERKFPRHADSFKAFVEDGWAEDISISNLKHEILQSFLEQKRLTLSVSLTRDPDSVVRSQIEEYLDLLDNGFAAVESTLEVVQGPSAALLKEYFDKENKFPIHPPRLNQHLGGGLVPQSHIVLFGRPEAGKTTFALNLARGWAKAGLKVLYWHNEDPTLAYHLRLIQAFTGASINAIRENIDPATQKAIREGMSNVSLVSSEQDSLSELERCVKSLEPAVVIVDQVRNIQVPGDSRTLQLESVCQGIRRIGQRHDCVCVSITQAGDSAEGKLYLDMGDIEWSNTGVQGTADLILGLGVTNELTNSGQRAISFPKNKVNGVREPCIIQMNTTLCQVN